MIKTGAQYRDDMERMKPSIYMMGEKVENYQKDPRFRSSFNLVALNHDICFDEKYRISRMPRAACGRAGRRFTHKLQTTQEDSLKKAQLTGMVCRHTSAGGACPTAVHFWTLTHDIDGNTARVSPAFQGVRRVPVEVRLRLLLGDDDPKGDRSLKLDQRSREPRGQDCQERQMGIVRPGGEGQQFYATCFLLTFACRARR